MKSKFLKYFCICICLFIIYYIFSHNEIITKNILYAVNLWLTKVFPALFPMFIINDFLLYLDFPIFIANLFTPIIKKFKLNAYAIYVYIMSLFSGSPTNAVIIKQLVKDNKISCNDASYIISFTYFSNPLFLWTMLNVIFETHTTIKIIGIQYITNFIIFIIFKGKIKPKLTIEKNSTHINVSKFINKSIKKNIDTLLMILGTITFYLIISTILSNYITFNNTLVKGFIEITQGLNLVNTLSVSTKLKEIIAVSIISFGGLSIHTQINNVIEDTNIKYKYFLIGRIIQLIISNLLIILF